MALGHQQRRRDDPKPVAIEKSNGCSREYSWRQDCETRRFSRTYLCTSFAVARSTGTVIFNTACNASLIFEHTGLLQPPVRKEMTFYPEECIDKPMEVASQKTLWARPRQPIILSPLAHDTHNLY
jgi:hypothetical protein